MFHEWFFLHHFCSAMDWSVHSKMNDSSDQEHIKHLCTDGHGQKWMYVERTQYGGQVELHVIEHHPHLCLEYVVTSPKFSVKQWLLWTSFFNILGFALKLHTQVHYFRKGPLARIHCSSFHVSFYASTHFREPKGPKHYVFGFSIPPSVQLSVLNLVNTTTPECMREFLQIWWKCELWYDNELIRFWVSQVQIWAKLQFGAIIPFKCTRYNFCQWKTMTGSMLSIAEKLRWKSQHQGHQMTKYGQKRQFWGYNIILMCQVGIFFNQNNLLGQC